MFPGLWRKQDCDQVECTWDLVSNSGQRKLTNSSRNYCTLHSVLKSEEKHGTCSYLLRRWKRKNERGGRTGRPGGRMRKTRGDREIFKDGQFRGSGNFKKIPEVTLIPCRKTFGFVRSMDEETKRECAAYHRELFGEAVKLAEHADLVVFDEIMAAVNYGMVPERDVLEFLENRPGRDQTDGLEIVLTGRDPSEKLIAAADYVSEICKRKHPFDRGIMARRGVEY